MKVRQPEGHAAWKQSSYKYSFPLKSLRVFQDRRGITAFSGKPRLLFIDLYELGRAHLFGDLKAVLKAADGQ
ncbi:hypothetical protein PBY51_015574 [Eleginops maclovinus]|uniref:Uncharacterized protein n=1 Tax=Eleginops maclovinus TaxID=56733 RepID=A0AAN7XNH0_ELEMC|nr:hypothetical protein PBY51_015574 [Eleginops maclovinus]